MILERDTWTDKSISFLVSDIVEYDIKDAGFSIIKERGLLPPGMIAKLTSIRDKKTRHTEIGKLQRGPAGKPLRDGLSKGFKDTRAWFGDANRLCDDDILSVKKDAIFVKKFCYELAYGEHIRFVEKNVYTAFMQFDKYEFYMSETGLDVKGIRDDQLELHKNGLLPIVKRLMVLLSQYEDEAAVKYMVKVMNDYKFYRLPVECYREMNAMNGYRVWQNDNETVVSTVGESYKENLIIDYNYNHILIPMLNIAIK